MCSSSTNLAHPPMYMRVYTFFRKDNECTIYPSLQMTAHYDSDPPNNAFSSFSSPYLPRAILHIGLKPTLRQR